MNIAAIDGKTFTALFLAVLTAGLAIAYANSFAIGFYFDDGYGIRDNPAIRSLANIPRFFTDPFTLTTVRMNVDVRPVLVTTYALNYAISGNDPWSYHALNLVVHFLAAVMVFVLVRDHVWWPASRRGADGSARLPAAAAALFFALAPINNQALNYMWARSALLCTMFFLAAFLAMMNRRVVLAVVFHALALGVKAIALTLPAVFVAYDFFYRDRSRHPDLRSWLRDWKELVPPLAPLVAVNVVYLVYRHMLLPEWAYDALREAWVTPWIWCISQWPALLFYVRIFVWPSGLSVDHDFPFTLSVAEFRAWGSLLVLAAWIAASLRFSRRLPHVAFATVWFFVTLAPESTVTPLAEVVNDHRPYIASALGLAVLLAWLVERAAALANRSRREVFATLVLAISLAFAVVGHRRTAEWQSNDALWDATVATSPNNGRAWMNSGHAKLVLGNRKEARRRFERARELMPAYSYVYMNLSALDLMEGNQEAALDQARHAVRLAPTLSQTHFYLARALEAQGNLAEAVTSYRRAVEVDANDHRARAALERAWARLGAEDSGKAEAAMMAEGLRLLDGERDVERAVAQFRMVLARNPSHYGATFQLARALDAAGRPGEALPVWQKMLGLAQAAGDPQTETKVRERIARAQT